MKPSEKEIGKSPELITVSCPQHGFIARASPDELKLIVSSHVAEKRCYLAQAVTKEQSANLGFSTKILH